MATPPNKQSSLTWQRQNMLALLEQLRTIREHADGTVLVEAAGAHFLVLLKERSLLRLLLVEQADPSSSVTQSELDLDRPLWLEPYTQAMVLGLLWRPEPERVYIAGIGGGRVPQVLHYSIRDLHIDAVDLDPDVIRIAHQYFALPQDERLAIAVAEARTFLANQTGARYDLMLVDVFLDNGYTPYRMATVEFYQLCRARLRANGAVTVNLLTTDPYLADKLYTVQSVFPHVYTCSVPEENLIVIAGQMPVPSNFQQIACNLEARYALDFALSEQAEMLQPLDLDLFKVTGRSLMLLYDANPPQDYFDALPNLDSPFSRVAPDLPCPCGSGQRFAICHGGLAQLNSGT